MRLGIKAKQIAAVTAIVGLAVVGLSAVHVTRLARVVLRESQARGELLANAIVHRAREVVVAGAEKDRVRSEERTPELQSHSALVCRLLLQKKNVHRHERPSNTRQL